MPINLASLITPYAAPGSSYTGAAGSLMQLGNLRERNRSSLAQEALGQQHVDLRQAGLAEEQRQFDTQEAERQRQIREGLFKEWQEAHRAGDVQRAEAARQALERHGFDTGGFPETKPVADNAAATPPLTTDEIGATPPQPAEPPAGPMETEDQGPLGSDGEPVADPNYGPSYDSWKAATGGDKDRVWHDDTREAWIGVFQQAMPGAEIIDVVHTDQGWVAHVFDQDGARVVSVDEIMPGPPKGGAPAGPVPAPTTGQPGSQSTTPLPGDPLAFGAAPAAIDQPPQSPGGGRRVIRGPDGNIMGAYDVDAHRAEQVARVGRTFQGLIENAVSSDDVKAAKAAQDLAVSLLGTHPPETAIAIALDHYNRAAGRNVARPRGGSGGSGPVGAPGGLSKLGRDAWYKIQTQVRQNTQVAQAEKAAQALQRAMHYASGESGMEQEAAVRELIRMWSGATARLDEVQGLERSTGAINSLIHQLNVLVGSGQRTDEVMRQLRGVLQGAWQELQAIRRRAGEQAQHQARYAVGGEEGEYIGRGLFEVFTGEPPPDGGPAQAKPSAPPADEKTRKKNKAAEFMKNRGKW